jgi:hypothetical protein
MSKLSDFLASLTAPAKTLTEAKGALDQSRATLDSVAAMFTAAGLDLDAMLAAGPESLKAHLALLATKDAELAAALEKSGQLEAQLKTANDAIATHGTALALRDGFLSAIGFSVKPEATAEDAKNAFAKHTKEAAALELAKAGHPPVRAIVARVEPAAATADADHFKAYKAMPEGPEKKAYFAKHGEAIYRGAHPTT